VRPILSSPRAALLSTRMLPALALATAAGVIVQRRRSNTSSTSSTSNKTTDVVVVGASNMDLITYCKRIPGPGETIHGDTYEQGFGGKGANQAVMAAKLGAKTNIVTCIGNDGFGDETLRNFQNHGLGHLGVIRAPGREPTGVAPIWVDSKGENRILIVNGANDCLSPAHMRGPMQSVVASAKVLVCQLEIKAETTLAALSEGRRAGVLTVLNPAPAPSKPLDPAYYADADIIAPNQSEAQILTGCDTTTMEGAKEGAKKLISFGAKCVVMTLGKDGCLICCCHQDKSIEMTVVSCPALDTSKVKDTSGAGDCFLGAFAYHLTRREDWGREDCDVSALLSLERLASAAKYACVAATLSVQKNGTQSSYPDLETVERMAAGSVFNE